MWGYYPENRLEMVLYLAPTPEMSKDPYFVRITSRILSMAFMVRHLLFLGSTQMPTNCAQNPWCSEAHNITQLQMMLAFRNCGVSEVLGLSFPESSSWHNPQSFKRGQRYVLEPGIVIWELPFLTLGPLQVASQGLVCAWRLLHNRLSNRPDAIIVGSPITRM